MRVLVCGGREYRDRDQLFSVLDEIGATFIIHGNSRGADRLAHAWAVTRHKHGIACPANWARDGKRAGPLRNQRMLGHRPELVVAFPGGRGTADMVNRAKNAGIKVIYIPTP